MLQGIYNNSTTSTRSTDEVLSEIESVLKQLGISYEKDKYVKRDTTTYVIEWAHSPTHIWMSLFSHLLCHVVGIDFKTNLKAW